MLVQVLQGAGAKLGLQVLRDLLGERAGKAMGSTSPLCGSGAFGRSEGRKEDGVQRPGPLPTPHIHFPLTLRHRNSGKLTVLPPGKSSLGDSAVSQANVFSLAQTLHLADRPDLLNCGREHS